MKLKIFALALFIVFVLISCSTSRQLNSEKNILEGIIYSIGNDPFTKLGIQTSDGAMYVLKCTKKVEQELNTRQGKIVKVYYAKTEQSPEGLILVVTKYEFEK